MANREATSCTTPIVFGRLVNWVAEKTGKSFASWVHRNVIDKAGLDAHRAQMWTPPTDADGEPASYAYGWCLQKWRGQKIV